MFSPLRPGMVWNVLLDVVAADVVNFDACRSSDELAPPEAAMTATGMASTPAAATIGTIIFRMTTSRDPRPGQPANFPVTASCREDSTENACRRDAVRVKTV